VDVTTLKVYSTFVEHGFGVSRWRYSLMVAKVLSPASKGLSPSFLLLFVLTFDVGGHGGYGGDLIQLPLRSGIVWRQ
jgi:hypothetical protein